MQNNIVAVMAKHPELSKVKTRLAATVGDEKALEVYELLLENLCTQCQPRIDDTYKLGSFITPPTQIESFKEKYNNFEFYYPQIGNTLGEKMYNAFIYLVTDLQANKAMLIGADIPNLNANIIQIGCSKLYTHDIVLGPTDDGGYYLIGMKKVYSEIFENIRWGTSEVLSKTLKRCAKLSLSVYQLETLSDLDREEDLQKFPQIQNKMQ